MWNTRKRGKHFKNTSLKRFILMGWTKRKNIYVKSPFLTFPELGTQFLNYFNLYCCFCFLFYFILSFYYYYYYFYFVCFFVTYCDIFCVIYVTWCDIIYLIVLFFLFHGLHFVTTLRVLKPVLCFHMTSFNYGAKGARDVDPACGCHQSNIMPDSIFSLNIAQCVTCLFVFCFVLF